MRAIRTRVKVLLIQQNVEFISPFLQLNKAHNEQKRMTLIMMGLGHCSTCVYYFASSRQAFAKYCNLNDLIVETKGFGQCQLQRVSTLIINNHVRK